MFEYFARLAENAYSRLQSNGGIKPPKPSSLWGTWTPSNALIRRPTPLTTPNGTRIHSAVLPQYTFWTDRQTDRQTDRPTDGLRKNPVSRVLTVESDALTILLLTHIVRM